MSGELQVTSIEIYDVMGRVVANVETGRAPSIIEQSEIGQSEIGQSEIGQSEIAINIAHLPAGVYFVRITTDSGVVTRKVVKM